MSRQDAEKTISFSVQAVRITADLMNEMCRTFLNSPPKHGKVRYGDIAKTGKLESIEVTENNIGSFLDTARKYDIDYALKRDSSTSPPTYHVFFTTGHSENFRKAFAEYAGGMQSRLENNSVINREQIKQNAKIISQKSSEKAAEKHLSKSDIAGR
ncbi:PcfB family protein [Candidatus Pseudoruminococcus sp.]|uniref:PcfB family protein n=1 Tax=Candidatus Pseudoruminococcus sp. TaxID=3101048 RepID=UPI00399BB72D